MVYDFGGLGLLTLSLLSWQVWRLRALTRPGRLRKKVSQMNVVWPKSKNVDFRRYPDDDSSLIL